MGKQRKGKNEAGQGYGGVSLLRGRWKGKVEDIAEGRKLKIWGGRWANSPTAFDLWISFVRSGSGWNGMTLVNAAIGLYPFMDHK